MYSQPGGGRGIKGRGMNMFRARREGEAAGVRLSRQERNARAMATDHLQGNLGARTVQGGGILVAGNVVKIFLQLVSLAALGRLLGPDDFGVMAMCWAVLSFVTLFSDFGLSAATIQRKEIDQNTVSVLFFVGIGIGVVVTCILAGVAPVAAALFKDDRLLLAVPAIALTLPMNWLSAQHYALMNRTMRWTDLQIGAILSQAVGTVVAVLLAYFTAIGFWALIAQSWIGAFVYSSYLIARCDWRPSIPNDWRAAWPSIKLGLHLSGFSFLNYFQRQLDKGLVGWRWGSIELGHYARAYALLQVPINFANSALASAVQPALSRLQDKPEQWRRAYLDALAVAVFAGGAVAATLYGGAAPVIRTVYGPNWEETISIFGVLALALLFITPMGSVGWIYISLGRGKQMLHWAMVATPVYVLGFWLGLPQGAEGVAIAYSLSSALLFVPCFMLALRNTSVSFGDVMNVIWPTSLCAAAIGLSIRWLIADASTLLGLFVTGLGLCLYLVLAALLILTWPAYESVRRRALGLVDALRRRLGGRQEHTEG